MSITIKSAWSIAAAGAVLATSPVAAQSSASTYSYGTYNPVQAAINRDTMNEQIIRQTTGRKATRAHHRANARRHR